MVPASAPVKRPGTAPDAVWERLGYGGDIRQSFRITIVTQFIVSG